MHLASVPHRYITTKPGLKIIVQGRKNGPVIKVHAAKPEDPSSIPQFHMVEGEKQLLKIVL